jgi:hypothetical protein
MINMNKLKKKKINSKKTKYDITPAILSIGIFVLVLAIIYFFGLILFSYFTYIKSLLPNYKYTP